MDVHRSQQKYQRSFTYIWKSPLAEEDKHSIETFLKDQKTRGLSYARLVKLCQVLLKIGKMLGKTFEKAKEQDIKNLVHYYESGEYSFWTKHDIKSILKQFYAWLNKGTYPSKVAWINTTIPKKEKRLVNHKELLTQEEIIKLIDTASHPRDKALISVLSESGARIGEIATLHIKHVDIDTNGIVLNLDGKTGHRRIRLVTSTPHLITWLNNHPDKTNPNAPVWVSIGAINYHKSLSYESIRKNIQILFKKTSINKKCYPYIFRHTRACQLAHHFTEFQMNAYFGWVQGSEMPSTYIHISGKDLDEHTFLLHSIYEELLKYTNKVKTDETARKDNINPDIIFTNEKGEEIAIEIETGSNLKYHRKYLEGKVTKLNQQYPNKWHFVLSNAWWRQRYTNAFGGFVMLRQHIPRFIKKQFPNGSGLYYNATTNCLTQNIDDKKQESTRQKIPSTSSKS